MPEACNFIIKETVVQFFSSEFCEIFKNVFFQRTPAVAASVSFHRFYKYQYVTETGVELFTNKLDQ